MRKIEILRLKKQDINFKERKMIVQSAKTNKIRIIDIDLKLTIILYFYCKKLKNDELLFKLNSNSVSVLFYYRIKNSNIQKVTFHDLRHLHASYLLSKLRNHANAIIVVQLRLRSF